MISTSFSRWTARMLIFACAFAVWFLIGLLFGLLGYRLFANTLEEFLLATAFAAMVLYGVESTISRAGDGTPMLRALKLLLPHDHHGEPPEVRPEDLDSLRQVIHEGVLIATALFGLLAVAGFLNARAADAPRLWLFLAIFCVVLIPVLWIYRYERVRRIRAAKTRLFGPDQQH